MPPDEPQSLVKRLEAAKAVIVLCLSFIAAGILFADWQASVVHTPQRDAARQGAATALGAAQAGSGVQLGALQGQVQDLRRRQATIEGKLDVLVGMTQRLLDRGKAP